MKILLNDRLLIDTIIDYNQFNNLPVVLELGALELQRGINKVSVKSDKLKLDLNKYEIVYTDIHFLNVFIFQDGSFFKVGKDRHLYQ